MTYSYILDSINNIDVLDNDELIKMLDVIDSVLSNYYSLSQKEINNIRALNLLANDELLKRGGWGYEKITIW